MLVDESHSAVALVHEYGKWKAVTGGIEKMALAHDTAFKELREEV